MVGMLLALLLHAVGAAQEGTWHWVDTAAVICPKPSPAPVPAPEPYSVGIQYDSTMDIAAPHILGFMRTSNKQMKVSFRVEDNLGKQVLPEQSFTLKALGQAAPSSCQCNNSYQLPAAISGLSPPAGYGAGYGIFCRDHDNTYCDKWWGNTTVGKWCCREWCYIAGGKKECPDAIESSLVDGLYWSDLPCYATPARTEPKYNANCPWIEKAVQNDPCTCKDSFKNFSAAMKDTFSPSYGSSCWAWDVQTCELNYASQVDTWCCQNWCYVDRLCPSAKPSLNAGMSEILFWTANFCKDDPKKMSQCKFKPVFNTTSPNAGNCSCRNDKMPADLKPSHLPENYGHQCAPHDAAHCNLTYPTAQHDMWCCESWCWVDESCPGAQEHLSWPGHYRSKVNCPLDPQAIAQCPFSSACNCISSPGADILNRNARDPSVFSADYGGSCKAWESTNCKAVWGPGGMANSADNWDSSSANDWCCDSWCYVNLSCPIAKLSWLVKDTQNHGVDDFYYSYEVCEDADTVYKEDGDMCVAPSTTAAGNLRRLASRRRGGGSSSSFSSSRRRSPPAPSASSRRRSYSAPSVPTRRRYPAPPRRRIRRRRTPVGASPSVSQTQVRRRATSMNGQSYQTSNGQNYGYTSQPQMMNNYGGAQPYQTSYGYSGYNAYPQKSNANIAMYAGGGFVAGAATGILISSAMSSNRYDYGGGYGYHRYGGIGRRRMHNGRYCLVPEGRCGTCYHQAFLGERDRPGDMIDCGSCYSRYDYCLDSSACYTTSGCGYQTQSNYNRDDLATTGFIPKDFQAPLKVIITNIESDDLNRDPSKANICPPLTATDIQTWQSGNITQTLRMDLFVVLTKQDPLDPPPPACDRNTYKGCWGDSCTVPGSFCGTNDICECPQGACYDRHRGRCTSDQTVQQDGAARGELAWLLVMGLAALVCK